VSMADLRVKNPAGYTNPELMVLGKGSVQAKIGSLMGDPARIERIDLSGVHLVIEQKGLTNNLQTILDGIAAAGGTGDKKPKEEGGKSLQVGELEISDVTVDVKLLPIPGQSKDVQLKLAPIRLSNLGTADKLSVAELSTKVLLAIAGGIAEQGAGVLPQEIIGPMQSFLTEQGKVLLETGTQILEQGKSAGEQIIKEGAKGIEEGIKGVGGALEGLLKKEDKK